MEFVQSVISTVISLYNVPAISTISLSRLLRARHRIFASASRFPTVYGGDVSFDSAGSQNVITTKVLTHLLLALPG